MFSRSLVRLLCETDHPPTFVPLARQITEPTHTTRSLLCWTGEMVLSSGMSTANNTSTSSRELVAVWGTLPVLSFAHHFPFPLQLPWRRESRPQQQTHQRGHQGSIRGRLPLYFYLYSVFPHTGTSTPLLLLCGSLLLLDQQDWSDPNLPGLLQSHPGCI